MVASDDAVGGAKETYAGKASAREEFSEFTLRSGEGGEKNKLSGGGADSGKGWRR